MNGMFKRKNKTSLLLVMSLNLSMKLNVWI